MSGEHFSLVWNTFPRNLSSGLYSLLTGEQLVDVTLAAEGQILRAHKLILSVCSTYFRDLFKGNTCKHPIVILKDVSYRDLSAMLHFMYQGEVNIKQEDIASFLKVAEILKIKGLTRTTEDEPDNDLIDALPLIHHHHERTNNNVSMTPMAHAGEPFCEPGKSWGSPCQCGAATTATGALGPAKEEVSIKAFREPPDALLADKVTAAHCAGGGGSVVEALEILKRTITPCPAPLDEDQPLDCSAGVEDAHKQQQQQQQQQHSPEYPSEYKAELNLIRPDIQQRLTPEVECVQRSSPAQTAAVIAGANLAQQHGADRQEGIEAISQQQPLIPAYSAPHCRGESSVGFHSARTPCNSGDYPTTHDPAMSCTAASTGRSAGSGGSGGSGGGGGGGSSSSKGRRTVKGLPGSSLSMETTLRVISELGPTIRMERGKAIRMYSCPWCLRHFTRKENLKLHVRYIHGPLQILTCKLCGNKYKNSNSLRVHSYLYHNAQRNKSSPSSSSGGSSNKPRPSILDGNA